MSDPVIPMAGQNINAIRDCINNLKSLGGFEPIQFEFHHHWNIDKVGWKYLRATRNWDSIYHDLNGEKPIVSVEMPQKHSNYYQNVEGPTFFNQVIRELDSEIDQFWKRWQDLQLDALICPVECYFIPRIGQYNLGDAPSFSRVTNLLHMPAVVIPVRTSNFSDEKFPKGQRTSKLFQDIEDTSQKCQGLPIGIQILTKPFQDEFALALAQMIQKIIRV